MVRSAIGQFAHAMERKLKTRDDEHGESGWLNTHTTINMLLARLRNEAEEAQEAYEECNPNSLADECVDIANFAMMIRDRLERNCLLTCKRED